MHFCNFILKLFTFVQYSICEVGSCIVVLSDYLKSLNLHEILTKMS